MNKFLMTILLALAVFILLPAKGHAQNAYTRKGFMIQGIFTKHITMTTMPDSFIVFEPSAVPLGVIGYRFPRIGIGLGGTYFRQAVYEKNGGKDRYGETGILFTPRVEGIIFQDAMAIAEAYIAGGIGFGFYHFKQKHIDGVETESKETYFMLGLLLGIGGRYFLGGGPFALGLEFGWDGVFIHDTDDDPAGEISRWSNTNGLYVAITGQFVFEMLSPANPQIEYTDL